METSVPGDRDRNGAPNHDEIRLWVREAAALLPTQGPITSFAFLNPLQAFEDIPFEEGLIKGANLFGCRPYVSEQRFREHLAAGRIRSTDLIECLEQDLPPDELNASVSGLCSRRALRLTMLGYPLQSGGAEELRWFIAETDALKKIRRDLPREMREAFIESTRRWGIRTLVPLQSNPDIPQAGLLLLARDLLDRTHHASLDQWSEDDWEECGLQLLWRVIKQGVHASHAMESRRHPQDAHDLRFSVQRACGVSSAELVDRVLIRFCASFLDQGQAAAALPGREAGFWQSFLELYRGSRPDQLELGELPEELQRITTIGLSPLDSIQESLGLLQIPHENRKDYLDRTVVALRGWAGMLWQAEDRADRISRPVPNDTLVEYVAIRLIVERVALLHLGRMYLQHRGSLSELLQTAEKAAPPVVAPGIDQSAFTLLQLAQCMGWTPDRLHSLHPAQWKELLHEVSSFGSLARCRMFHRAFERRYRIMALDALAHHQRYINPDSTRWKFQAAFCIDAREESFRRHLEEVEPNAQTFGVAGFFGIPMYYRGASEVHFKALCPIVLKPRHWVTEEVVYSRQAQFQRQTQTRRAFGQVARQLHTGSHGLMMGALISGGLGALASVPLVARILFPRITGRLSRMASGFIEEAPASRLRLERTAPEPSADGNGIGFSREEMSELAERLLRDLGLIDEFARLVLLIGHASSCLNNPHKSAYDCGACSGLAGGPNARAMATIINDPRIRAVLQTRGISIPDDTRFVGGEHNTATDVVRFFDLDDLPPTHTPDFDEACKVLAKACERNAHERCRRFYSAPLTLSLAAAHRHAAERTEDMAQTRPEFGNATNAMCFVGRRQRTRGLFLDRRSFLTSYDPLQDDAQLTILARLLGAVVPVCGGINLQYTLAATDPAGWGSGTKLPHNVTSLLGVMDGAASDLRPGLPLQGVEIHEPMRLLMVVEADVDAVRDLMRRDAGLRRMVQHGWIQFAALSPSSSRIFWFEREHVHPHKPGTDAPPVAHSSEAWYRGRRDHLEIARIDPTHGRNQVTNPTNRLREIRPSSHPLHSPTNGRPVQIDES